jgi:hypothetical protein
MADDGHRRSGREINAEERPAFGILGRFSAVGSV